MTQKLKNIVIIRIEKTVYRICFLFMSKREARKLMANSNVIDKKGFLLMFFHYIKMDNTTYYQRNREIMLNRAKVYYENDKERLREQARNKYRNLSEEDEEKKESMEKTDIEICLKKKAKIKRISKTKISKSKRV